MKLSQLRNLVCVAEAGSIRQASRDMHLSQSAVTKSIKQLEDEVGAELFYRSANGVVPTEIGSALIGRAKVVEAELRHARSEIETLQSGITGEIRVAASPTVTSGLLPSTVLSVKRARPGVSFFIEEGVYPDILSSVRTGAIDFALCLVTERISDETLHCEILVRDRLAVATRSDHPLAAKRKLTLRDFSDAGWIIYRRSHTGRDIFERTFTSNNLAPPKTTIECASFACALSLVEGSDYMTLVPKQFFVNSPRRAGIAPLKLESTLPVWNLAAIYRANHALSPICQEFLKELRRIATSPATAGG